MSMLAESRRKQKLSVDPQGKRWSRDNEKIGQKMLEKMGWTSGKGLGINEQGIIEHVRIHKKNPEYGKAGIGYDKDSYIKDLHEHQDKFNDFLQQLSKHYNQEETVEKSESNKEELDLNGQSLELKSKQSRARLHYQKFTRGKDVSKYNLKDLANIFGRKELMSETKVNMEKDNNIYENEAIDTKDNWNGVITINKGSMSDYFKQKLPNHKKPLPNDIIDNQAADSGSETEQCVGFGFIPKTENICSTNEIPMNYGKKDNYAFDNPCLGMNNSIETMPDAEKPQKSPPKRKEFVPEKDDNTDLYIEEMNEIHIGKKSKIEIIDNYKDGFMNPALNLDMKPNEVCNGKEFEVSRAEFGLENCALDLTDEKSNKKRVTFNDHVEYNIDAIKRKKGKATLDKFEVENKKHKKKRKRESIVTPLNGFVNEALDVEILSTEINDNELNEHKSTKVKKRKIYKTSSLETIQESPEREKEIKEVNLEDVIFDNTTENKEIDTAIKKSKKKKKNKEEIKTIDSNIATAENEKEVTIERIIRNKKHKLDTKRKIYSKEKKEDKEKYETMPNETSENLEIEQQHTNVVKIKKKKSKNEEIIIEDSPKVKMSPVVTIIKRESVSLETENTVRKKKKKHNKDNHLENEISTCNVKKEISDKENIVESQESNIKLPKKDKKRKRSKDALDTEVSTNSSADVINANTSNQKNVDNAEFIDILPEKSEVMDSTNDVIHSPWNRKAKMTKRMLKRLFHKNLIADFPGSNIQEIKGYGVDV